MILQSRQAEADEPAPARISAAPPALPHALDALLQAGGEAASPLAMRRWLELAEVWYITRTLDAVRGNRSAAARALGIGRRTLYAKMQKLGIEERWAAGEPERP